MHYAFCMFALAALAANAANAARATFGARLSLPNGVAFAPVVFDDIWKRHGAGGSAEAFTMECGIGASENATDGALRFSGRASFRETGDGGIEADWRATPDRDGALKEVCVGSRIPKARCSGGIRIGEGLIPIHAAVPPNPHLFRGAVKSMEFLEADGIAWLAISFPEEARVLVQDNQTWGKSIIEIRIMMETGNVEKGREYAVKAVFSTPGAPLALADDKPLRMEAGPDWIPLSATPAGEDWIEPGSALDFSGVVPHHEPAGQFGRPVVVGDHFELEGRPGEEFRLCGANIVHGANLPAPATTERFAANLARLGYNTVRIHHHDAWLASPETVKPRGDGAGLDIPPGAWESFDALVAACVRHGLYITTDLYVSRYKAMTWRALGIDRDGRVDQRQFKVLCAFHEPSYSNLVAWTRLFLGHVNPHTGRSLASEPALVSLALVNEGNLGNDGIAMLAKVPEVTAAWNEWRASRAGIAGNAGDDAPRPLPSDVYDGSGKKREIAEFALFLSERETAFYERLAAEVRALGCRAPLSNLSSWYYPAQYLLPISRFDYMDSHFYVDHPMFLGKNWRFPSACNGNNPFRTGSGVPAAAWRRLFGKPFCITEWNWSAPGPYRSASGLTVGALAARQGWSGLWRFAWSHDRAGVEAPGSLPMRYFDLHSDPVSLASERATLCLFLRGDMEPLPPENERPVVWNEKSLRACAIGAPRLGTPIEGVSPWESRVGVRLARDENKGPRSSKHVDGKQYPSTVIDKQAGTFTVTTPRTCGGFAGTGMLDCGPLKFSLLPIKREAHLTPQSGGSSGMAALDGVAAETVAAATIWASSLDGEPIRRALRLLVVHATDARNTGAVFDGDSARVWQEQGGTPALVRRGIAKIELQLSEKASSEGDDSGKGAWHVWRLSASGHRVAEVAADFAPATGSLSFTADTAFDPTSATLYYEVVRDR